MPSSPSTDIADVPLRRVQPALRRTITAISLLWLATAAGAAMAFLAQTLLARELGPSDYGLFASSLATITMLAPLAAFGLSQYWLQVYGVEGWNAERWLRPSLRFIGVTTALSMAIIVLWAFVGAPADATRPTLLILLPVILSVLTVDLVGSKLRLEERYNALALWQLSIPSSRLAVAILLLLIPTLAGRFVALGYGAISLAVALLALPQLRAMLRGEMKLHGHGPRPAAVETTATSGLPVPTVSQLWSQAWAYGLNAALYPIFFQISTVLLKYMSGNAQAGMFSIALAVMMAIYLIPATVYQKFLLSKLHRWAVHDRAKFWLVYRKGNLAMLLSGLLISAAMVVLAPWLVPIAFGEKYRPVVKILMVLALCPPIRFLYTSVSSALLSETHMRYRVYAMAMAALVAVLFNVLLIPHYGELGAAVATVISETMLLAGTYWGVRKFNPPMKVGA